MHTNTRRLLRLSLGSEIMLIITSMKAVIASLLSLALTFCAQAERADLDRDRLVKALTEIAYALPEEKHGRAFQLIEAFADGGMRSNYDYGWQRAQPYLERGGVSALIAEAHRSNGTLRYATPDALLATGVRRLETSPADAKRLNDALLDLARRADDFERQLYAHASAELAALRCDRAHLDQSLQLLKRPDSLNYKFWEARLSNNAAGVISGIDTETPLDDTRDIHQAIDGYRLIADFGYCEAQIAQIAD